MRRALALLAVLGAVAPDGLRQRPARLADARRRRLQPPRGLRRPRVDVSCSTAPTPGVRVTAGTKVIDRIKTEVERRRPARLDQVARHHDRPRPARRRRDQPRRAGALALRVDGIGRRQRSAACRRRTSSCASTAPATSRPAAASTTSRSRSTAPPRPTSRTSRRRTPSVRTDGSGDAEPARRPLAGVIVEGSGDVTYSGRPSVQLAPRGLGQRAPQSRTRFNDDDPGDHAPGRRYQQVLAERSTRPRAAPSAPGAGRGA